MWKRENEFLASFMSYTKRVMIIFNKIRQSRDIIFIEKNIIVYSFIFFQFNRI